MNVRIFNCNSNHDGLNGAMAFYMLIPIVARLVRAFWKGGK